MDHLYGWGLPVDISTHGYQIDRLIIALHVMMGILFAGWALFLILALFRFRFRSGHKAQYETGHYRLPAYLEVVVAALEVVFLFAFSLPLWIHIKKLPPPDDSLQVRVVAEQFAWNIHYPGPDGRFGRTDVGLVSTTNPLGLDPEDEAAKDDLTTINQLHVPLDTPVTVELSAKDVIHSFGIPVMRIKQDAIPGQRIKLWFQAKKTGQFEIACAQLCGLGHYRMRGFFIVEPPEAFQTWLEEQAALKTA